MPNGPDAPSPATGLQNSIFRFISTISEKWPEAGSGNNLKVLSNLDHSERTYPELVSQLKIECRI
jgi:hypothetical protein